MSQTIRAQTTSFNWGLRREKKKALQVIVVFTVAVLEQVQNDAVEKLGLGNGDVLLPGDRDFGNSMVFFYFFGLVMIGNDVVLLLGLAGVFQAYSGAGGLGSRRLRRQFLEAGEKAVSN